MYPKTLRWKYKAINQNTPTFYMIYAKTFENTFVSHDQECLSCQIPLTFHADRGSSLGEVPSSTLDSQYTCAKR